MATNSIPDHIFKGYDIRAIVPDEMNVKNIYQIVQAVLNFYQQKLNKVAVKIIVGHDMRISAPELYPIVKKALLDGGAHIIDVGLVSTPTYYFAILYMQADAGIQLTASHNPPAYNGLKMIMRAGDTIRKIGKPTGILEIKDYAQAGISVQNPGGREEVFKDIVELEIDAAFKHVDPTDIKPFKVVADPANAMAITFLEPLFKRLPGTLIKMNFELDGTFPSHQPDPLVFENLKDLRERVKAEKADIGLGPDGDGDRLFFIDENGDIVTGSQSTAIVARDLLQEFPGATIMYDVRNSMTPKTIIEENGGIPSLCKVGHAYITEQMNHLGALYAGESSEHNFFKWSGGGESTIIMILLMLRAMSRSGKKLSQLVSEIRRCYESGEYNYVTDKSDKILSELKTAYSDAQISDFDGVTLDYPDWRCNIRTSNTEPLMRLNVEAKTEELMKQKLSELQSFVVTHGAVLHGSH